MSDEQEYINNMQPGWREENAIKARPTGSELAAPAGWAAKQVWPSLEAITLRCDRPLAGSMGFHWWYNDHEAMEEAFEAGKELDYVPIVCKSCGLQLKLSVNAPEYPAV